MMTLHCTLDGQTDIVAHVVVGQKKYPLAPMAVGAPMILIVDGSVPLFKADG